MGRSGCANEPVCSLRSFAFAVRVAIFLSAFLLILVSLTWPSLHSAPPHVGEALLALAAGTPLALASAADPVQFVRASHLRRVDVDLENATRGMPSRLELAHCGHRPLLQRNRGVLPRLAHHRLRALKQERDPLPEWYMVRDVSPPKKDLGLHLLPHNTQCGAVINVTKKTSLAGESDIMRAMVAVAAEYEQEMEASAGESEPTYVVKSVKSVYRLQYGKMVRDGPRVLDVLPQGRYFVEQHLERLIKKA